MSDSTVKKISEPGKDKFMTTGSMARLTGLLESQLRTLADRKAVTCYHAGRTRIFFEDQASEIVEAGRAAGFLPAEAVANA